MQKSSGDASGRRNGAHSEGPLQNLVLSRHSPFGKRSKISPDFIGKRTKIVLFSHIMVSFRKGKKMRKVSL